MSNAEKQVAQARGGSAFKRGHIEPYDLPDESFLKMNKVQWRIDPNDAVLLVHDMQNYWVRFYRDPQPLVSRVKRLRDLCESLNIPIFYTGSERTHNLAERGLGLQVWGPGIGGGKPTDEDLAITSELNPLDHHYMIAKPRHSAFFKTDLQDILLKMNRRQIILCGVFAHHGVLVTAVEAYMRNYKNFLVIDAVADYGKAEHEMGIKYVAEMCGQLTMTAQVERELLGAG